MGISRLGRVPETAGDVLEKGLQRQCLSQHSGWGVTLAPV